MYIPYSHLYWTLGNPDAWQGAVDVLKGNSINLMNAIKELLKTTQVASVSSKGAHSLNLQKMLLMLQTHRHLHKVFEPYKVWERAF